ncbi:MAG: single-stranded DNA-binding protein [Candidatus Puniceispirillales bacterium]
MSGSVNKVVLLGRLGKDPEIVSLNDGNKIIKFSLATSENWKDRNTGERRERTEWHNIVIFNENLGRIAEQYLRKGNQVYLEGTMQTRKWQDQNGNDRYTTEVVLPRFRGELTLLGGRDSGGGDGAGYGGSGGASYGSSQSSSASGQGASSAPPMGNDLDDDIPF